MGIVKVSLREKGSNNHVRQISPALSVGELDQGDRLLQERDHADDSDDDCELADLDCEFAKVGDQIYSVPYDLYNLANLKELLSLETWNSCLSEEERFSLSAYLPDMDQETFWLTMKELLNGENIFFGSPLEVFFKRLKGGFYSLKVSQFREALQCLHKRGYYHSLRLYHENLAQTFVDMKKAWSDCQPSMDVEERVHIWNKWKAPKPVYVVDLNVLPADEEVLTVGDKNVSSAPLSKKMKHADNRVMDGHASTGVFSGAVLSLAKVKPKGVLKIKSISKNSDSSSTMQSLPCDSWGKLRSPPKGVLKIKPKIERLCKQDRAEELPTPHEPRPAETSGLQTFRLSPPQLSTSKWDMDNGSDRSSLPHQKVMGGKFSGSSELSSYVKSQQRAQLLNRDSGLFNHLRNFERRKMQKVGFHSNTEFHCLPVKNFQKPDMYSLEIDVGSQNCENLGQHSGPWTLGLCSNSTELHPPALVHSQGRRHTSPPTSGTISRTSAVGPEETGSFGKSLDRVEHRHRDMGGKGLLKQSDQPAVTGVPREGFTLPLTYKRKKGHSKHNSVEHIQQPVEKLDSGTRIANGSDSHLVDEAKSMKIKLKMWNAPDTQYKQGLLNGL